MGEQRDITQRGLAIAGSLDEAPLLQTLFDMQTALLEALAMAGKGPLGPGNPGLMDMRHDDKRPLHRLEMRERALMEQFTAIIHESVEARDWLPWKFWRVRPPINDLQARDTRDEVAMEVVDILHFVINCALLLGLGPKQLAGIYMAKHKENMLRIAKGY